MRPSSTTRTRRLAASSAAVYSYSWTSVVYVALPLASHPVRSDAPGPLPHCGSVVPNTGAENGCGVVPRRARTRHWKRPPSG